MKKQILNIGKVLSRAEQKLVFGGNVLMNADGGGGGEKCRDVCNSGNLVCATGLECFRGPCMGEDTWMCREV